MCAEISGNLRRMMAKDPPILSGTDRVAEALSDWATCRSRRRRRRDARLCAGLSLTGHSADKMNLIDERGAVGRGDFWARSRAMRNRRQFGAPRAWVREVPRFDAETRA